MFVLVLAAVSAALGSRTSGAGPVVIARVAHVAALLFCGLFAGMLMAVLVLELALRGVDASVYTRVRHVELAGLDVLASATLLPALVATVLLAVAHRADGRTSRSALTALVLLAAALTVSLVVNVPINTEQLTWAVEAPPPDWATVRDQWQFSHVARTAATVLAFGCLCAAAVRPSSSGRPAAAVRAGVGATR
jgi:uncharacterized membrane protein